MAAKAVKLTVTEPKSRITIEPMAGERLLGRTDVRNIGLLLVGFLVFLVLVPPLRSYPINDDWIYAHSVLSLMRFDYAPEPWAQATSLAHIAWGALFALVLGPGYSSLGVANLVMSAFCIVCFYVLLRNLRVTSPIALFGTALLACNPVYVNLSYSFMTDITFLCFTLIACLCFVRAFLTNSEVLFWTGSIATCLSFLTRQFGLVLVPIILFYLWRADRLTLRRAMAVSLLPVAIALIYVIWLRSQPTPVVDYAIAQVSANRAQVPFQTAVNRLDRIARALSIVGLCLLPLAWIPKRLAGAALLFIFLVFFLLVGTDGVIKTGTFYPFTGNIIDHTGFNMCCDYVAPIWSEAVWTILALAGTALVSALLISSVERIVEWFRSGAWRRPLDDPALFVYAACFALSLAGAFLPSFVFDRYFLPANVGLTLVALRRIMQSSSGTLRLGSRWLLVVSVLVFSVIAQHDYMAHRDARWRAAEQLVAVEGAARNQVVAGYEWDGEFLFEAAARHIEETGDYSNVRFPPPGIVDPVYIVSDFPVNGYEEIRRLSYASWLNLGQTQPVLELKRK